MNTSTVVVLVLVIVVLGIGGIFLFKKHQDAVKPPVTPNSQNPNIANTICAAGLSVAEKSQMGASASAGANQYACDKLIKGGKALVKGTATNVKAQGNLIKTVVSDPVGTAKSIGSTIKSWF